MGDFGRGYEIGTPEYALREGVFQERLASILAHNADPAKGWKRGVNKFADMTHEEFKSSGSLGYNKLLARHLAAQEDAFTEAEPELTGEPFSSLPHEFDWRSKGVVSDVKDQGHCGSCWAFGTTATVESHAAIATGTLETLSTQQLVSCAPNPLHCGGVGGCEGSIPEVAYNYIQLYGMTSEWMYSYSSYHGETGQCSFNGTTTASVVTIDGYRKIPSNSYHDVMAALVRKGPLAINVQANTWSDYESGIFAGCSDMSNVDLDHVVQLVGYGWDGPEDAAYWLVRNSWDATWGENGYIRLRRTEHNECGVDVSPLDGTGCSGGPATQHVCGECGMLFDVSYPLGAKIVKYGHHMVV